MRRGSTLQLVVIGLGAGAVSTAAALLVPWLPIAASRQAGRIDFTFWFATVISLVVFSFVMTVLVYAWKNFRVADNDFSEDGPPIHGNTTLEVVWTAVPFVLVTAIAIVSAIVLSDNGKAGTDPLKITVIGQQFAWTFQYPNGQIYPTMHLPLDRPVVLAITSKDVIHSFWVPQFAQKQDALPGVYTRLVITPDRLGNFPVICVELCGLGHSLMRSQAIVMSAAAYAHWYKRGDTEGSPAVPRARSRHSRRAAARLSHLRGDARCGRQGRARAQQSEGRCGVANTSRSRPSSTTRS